MPKVVVGLMGSSVKEGSSSLATPEQVAEFLTAVKSFDLVHELDTARVYNAGKSEELLGEAVALKSDVSSDLKSFAISTKAPGWTPGILSHASILSNCAASLAALRLPSVDIYYIHGPDRTVPLDEQCRAMNELYTQGKFRRFGISNLTADEVRSIHEICTKEGYVLPTVYQGGYSAIARSTEESLFPLLKQLGIAFYAYSPLAGGMLAKPIEKILNPDKGTRFDAMPVFRQIYTKDNVLNGLKILSEACENATNEDGSSKGISIMEASLRWLMHHSPLDSNDGIIIGASKTEQIQASLAACKKGRLPATVVEAFDRAWKEADGKA